MSRLRALLADYLLLRRSLGYKLVRAEALLDEFVSYLEGAGVPHITVTAALSWAVLPPNALSNWRAQRLGVVRCFARYCNVIDPSHQVPPTGLVSRGRGRPAPFIYSAEQVGVLMRAARDLRHAQRAATLEAVVGLMAVSGMRVAEVVRLDVTDVDFAEGALIIRASKAGKSRLLPLHPSTVEALRAYASSRDRRWPRPKTARFFVSSTGTALATNNLGAAFAEALSRSGLSYIGRRPRLGDFRHSFAVDTLVNWHLAGAGRGRQGPVVVCLPRPRQPGFHLLVLVGLTGTAGRGGEPPGGRGR